MQPSSLFMRNYQRHPRASTNLRDSHSSNNWRLFFRWLYPVQPCQKLMHHCQRHSGSCSYISRYTSYHWRQLVRWFHPVQPSSFFVRHSQRHSGSSHGHSKQACCLHWCSGSTSCRWLHGATFRPRRSLLEYCSWNEGPWQIRCNRRRL